MNEIAAKPTSRRAFIGGLTAGGALLALPACSSLPAFSFTEAVRRMLLLSSERAFARLTAPDGFWDQQVAEIGLGNMLGARGDVLSRILTSALFKDRLQDAFADVAIEGSYRAAPIVADAVRVIGIQNAADLVRGGPRAATAFLRGEMGGQLVEAMVPEISEALRVANDPLVGEALNALVGVNVGEVTNRFAGRVNDAIWNEMGYEEEEIRRNPRSTNDPVIIGAFGTAAL